MSALEVDMSPKQIAVMFTVMALTQLQPWIKQQTHGNNVSGFTKSTNQINSVTRLVDQNKPSTKLMVPSALRSQTVPDTVRQTYRSLVRARVPWIRHIRVLCDWRYASPESFDSMLHYLRDIYTFHTRLRDTLKQDHECGSISNPESNQCWQDLKYAMSAFFYYLNLFEQETTQSLQAFIRREKQQQQQQTHSKSNDSNSYYPSPHLSSYGASIRARCDQLSNWVTNMAENTRKLYLVARQY